MWGRVDQGAFYPSPSQAFLWTDLLERLSKYTFKSRRSGKEPGALHFLVSSQVLPKQLFQEAYTLRSKVLIILVDCRQSSNNSFFRESVVSTADGEWAPTNPDVPHHHPVPLFLPGGKVSPVSSLRLIPFSLQPQWREGRCPSLSGEGSRICLNSFSSCFLSIFSQAGVRFAPSSGVRSLLWSVCLPWSWYWPLTFSLGIRVGLQFCSKRSSGNLL